LFAFDYLTVLMESDPAVRLLKTVDAPTSERVEVDWLSLKENQEAEPLERLLQFYSKNGLDFVPPSPESIPVIKKLKEQSQIDETPLISEADAAALEEDPIPFAQKAARDTSLSQYNSSLCRFFH
jgi:small subunit ribosomal protein S5